MALPDVIGSGHDAASVGVDTDHAYPRGHLGNLTPDQDAAFSEFKRAAAERGLYDPQTSSHRDQDLLRYLRARKWNVEEGLRQLADTVAWRKANDLDVLYRTIDLDAYEQTRRLYPQWTGRRDKRGIPLYIFDVKTLDSRTVSTYEKEAGAVLATTFSRARPKDDKTPPTLTRLFALYENLMNFTMPLCTQLRDRDHGDTPISIATNIVDVSGVGLKQFWNLKGHMQAASQLATAHYPETLDRIYIVGAPFFFPTVWGWVKKWFDPVTVSKIFILADKDVKPTLTKFIAPENLPTRYGGELRWEFGDQPTVDPAWTPAVEWAPGHDSFVSSPCVWEEVDGGRRLACMGVGTVGGVDRRELICSVPKGWPSPVAPEGVSEGMSGGGVDRHRAREETNGTDASSSSAATWATPPTGASSARGDDDVNSNNSTMKNNTNNTNKGDAITSGEAVKAMVLVEEAPAEKAVEAQDGQDGDKTKTAEDIPPAAPSTLV